MSSSKSKMWKEYKNYVPHLMPHAISLSLFLFNVNFNFIHTDGTKFIRHMLDGFFHVGNHIYRVVIVVQYIYFYFFTAISRTTHGTPYFRGTCSVGQQGSKSREEEYFPPRGPRLPNSPNVSPSSWIRVEKLREESGCQADAAHSAIVVQYISQRIREERDYLLYDLREHGQWYFL